jgi:hypothetical protein
VLFSLQEGSHSWRRYDCDKWSQRHEKDIKKESSILPCRGVRKRREKGFFGLGFEGWTEVSYSG